MWIFSFCLSVASMALALLVCGLLHRHRQKKQKQVQLLPWLTAGFFFTGLFLFLPVVYGDDPSAAGVWQTALLSVLSAMKMFGGGDFEAVVDKIHLCPQQLQTLYRVWAVTLHAAAPICTAGIVLSVFRNISAKTKYFSCFFKDVYIFSGLSRESVVLARDLKQKNRKAAVVFTSVSDGALLEDAKSLDAVCFRQDGLEVSLTRHCPGKNMTFFAMGQEESQNIHYALGWIKQFRKRENTHLYVFAVGTESELLLSDVDTGAIRVRRIDSIQRLINRQLFENGCKLFDHALPGDNGTKDIGAVVVGLGRYGKEMVKALSWYCQMDGYGVRIHAFDKDPQAEDRFTALAPELMAPECNNVWIPGEAQYQITIHSGMDVDTASFAKKLGELKKTTFVFIALGSDEQNLCTAVNMRMQFERMGIHPEIYAVMESTDKKEALTGIRNFRGQSYDVKFIGDTDTCYSAEVIINSPLEEEALRRHLKWGSEEEFWKYEYNYRSSVASALHRYAKQHCGVAGIQKTEQELTRQERDALEVAEHRRWNAYMRAQGYIYSGSKDQSSRNDLGKMHHDLINYKELSEEDKRKDSAQMTV